MKINAKIKAFAFHYAESIAGRMKIHLNYNGGCCAYRVWGVSYNKLDQKNRNFNFISHNDGEYLFNVHWPNRPKFLNAKKQMKNGMYFFASKTYLTIVRSNVERASL